MAGGRCSIPIIKSTHRPEQGTWVLLRSIPGQPPHGGPSLTTIVEIAGQSFWVLSNSSSNNSLVICHYDATGLNQSSNVLKHETHVWLLEQTNCMSAAPYILLAGEKINWLHNLLVNWLKKYASVFRNNHMHARLKMCH